MTSDLLRKLHASRAFDPTPSRSQMAELHVPFDLLLGSTDYESRFRQAVMRGDRIALIGASGAGKSSTTEFVLNGTNVGSIAPLRIRMGMQTDAIVAEPSTFPSLLVSSIARQLDRDKKVRKADQLVRGGTHKRPVTLSLGGGISWLTGELALELGSVVTEPLTGEDVVEQAIKVLNLIRRRGLEPTLVFDDTDQWIRRPGIGTDPEPRIAAFFGPTLRMIADRLPAASVIAVHTDYVQSPHFDQAHDFLDTRITLPNLDRSLVGKLVTRRARNACDVRDLRTDQFIRRNALDRLFDLYLERNSVRRMLRNLNDALVRACDDGASAVETAHVVAAIAG
ncbi:hypothetical protein [Rhodococcus sovatensis]|uniref:AAA+ ATPase domain-containing protein n=1 Tax=Rhodococcus sovatensis TaxID=1805840 RepID=A0ABZ2PFP6_9NOCA